MVSDRIDQEDYRRGFILDGFPRTVAQAEALTAMLEQKGIKLDAVIDLKVDQAALIARMERRVADTLSAGGTVRSDDNPDPFARRLDEYRRKNATQLNNYPRRRETNEIDGMRAMNVVTSQRACGITNKKT